MAGRRAVDLMEGASGSYDSDPAIAAFVATVDEKIKH
jgi:hypothetical protein